MKSSQTTMQDLMEAEVAVESFHDLEASDPVGMAKALVHFCTVIIEVFVAPNATSQVNLNGKTQQDLIDNVVAAVNSVGQATTPSDQILDCFHVNLFRSAEEEVVELMKRDSWSRFRNDKLFEECLATMNNPNVGAVHLKQ